MKKFTLITALFAAFLLLFAVACAPASNTAAAATEAPASAQTAAGATAEPTVALLQLTLEELKQYDGQNGNPAYVAVDGVIYDVTDVPQWSGGKHNGYTAGQDLTDIIKNKSPHGVAKLQGVPVVGELVG
jgi:predicted heme/steroid binding protein